MATEHTHHDRRAHPTFMLPAEPPTWGKERTDKSYRERIKDWNQMIVGDMNALPYVVYVNYAIKLAAYWWLFTTRLANAAVSLYAEDNIKRFILYNMIGDALGFNSTGGPLGFRMKYFFVTWYNMLTPGSITCPLLPGVPAKRQVWQVVGFIIYIAYIVSALRTEGSLGLGNLAPIVLALAILTPFDLVTFQASRGEHSGYMLVACLFPWSSSAIHGLRLCQSMLWFWAGMAKCGPWMKYVNAFMLPNSKLLPILSFMGVPVQKLLYKDIPHDVNPSAFLGQLAHLAVLGEISLGPLCLFYPTVGVPLAWCFHLYIISMTPFASVMEWNCFCLFLINALFGQPEYNGYSVTSLFGAVTSSMATPLVCFLAFVLFMVPLYGQLYPKEVPFLVAFRPYAGNWRFTWHIVSNKAKNKLNNLKTLEGIFVNDNAKMLWGSNPHFCEQFEDYFTSNMVFFPHFRPIIPMVEELARTKGWGTDDYVTLFNEIFLNAITGWTLGTGFYVRGAYFDAVSSTCGFEKGECYVAVFEPQGLLDHTCEWHLVDITEPGVKVMHGKCPYADLEDMQPTEMTLEKFKSHSILGKKAQ